MFRPLFGYTHEIVQSLLRVEHARAAIDILPLPRSSINELRDRARGTRLEAGLPLDGVSQASYAAALNQLAHNPGAPPDERLLRSLQSTLTGGAAGSYRSSSGFVYTEDRTDLIYVSPNPADVPGLVVSALNWLASNWDRLSAVMLAGIFQQELLLIQPFERANDTLARLAGESVLQRRGYGFGSYASAETALASDAMTYQRLAGRTSSGVYSNPNNFDAWLQLYAAAVAAAAEQARAAVQACFDAGSHPETETLAVAAVVLRDRQRQALEHARANGAIRSGEYQQLAKIVPDTARRDFDELIEKGLIEVRGVGRGTHYVLTAQGLEEAQRRKS